MSKGVLGYMMRGLLVGSCVHLVIMLLKASCSWTR